MRTLFETQPENSSKNACRNTCEKPPTICQQIIKHASQNQALRPPEASSEPGWRWKPPKITPGGLWSIKILLLLRLHAFFSDFQKNHENQGRVRPARAAPSSPGPPLFCLRKRIAQLQSRKTRFPLPGPALGRKARTSAGQVSAFGLHALQRSYA